MAYLKTLGIFRLIAEQSDSSARLSWSGESPVLHTTMSEEQILSFFLETFKPTPIIAPWNGGSGFYGKTKELLDTICSSKDPRLEEYRNIIKMAFDVIPKSGKPKSDEKERLLTQLRAVAPDTIVPWLDTCFVLGETKPHYLALLGTGGNDGRLDFTNNFMQKISQLLIQSKTDNDKEKSKNLLESSLFGVNVVSLEKAAIGQFNPGGIGGPNSLQGKFEGESAVNPWDYILMMEGTLFFAGSVVRRLGISKSVKSSFPFTVDATAVGYGSATGVEETTDGSRAEIWLPLWSAPAGFNELTQLFSNGRAQLGKTQVRSGIEFALAVNLLGVDSGIESFIRYGFLKRNGLAFIATAIGRVAVSNRPKAQLLLDPPLTSIVTSLRRACGDKIKTPERYQAILRSLDKSFFDFTKRSEVGNDSLYFERVLEAVGMAEKVLSVNIKFAKEKGMRPLSLLSDQWVSQANDGSAEFRLAASLAWIGDEHHKIPPIREYIEQVTTYPYTQWAPESRTAVWSNRSLESNLTEVFLRRLMDSKRTLLTGIPLHARYCARLTDVVEFLHGKTDDEKIERLLWALMCVRPSEQGNVYETQIRPTIPAEYSLLRVLVGSHTVVKGKTKWLLDSKSRNYNAIHDPQIFYALARNSSNSISQSVSLAAQRLRAGGLIISGYKNRQFSGREIKMHSTVKPVRLLASMLFPLSQKEVENLFNKILYPIEEEQYYVA